MLVIVLGVIGLLASSNLVSSSTSTRVGGHLPLTEDPPENELGYWCTYVESCRFCWDCEDGICTSRVWGNNSTSIIENSYVKYCEVSRWGDLCRYDVEEHIYHSMNCSDPKPWNPYKIARKEWKKDEHPRKDLKKDEF